jgi:RNA polymerase sigma-B factor
VTRPSRSDAAAARSRALELLRELHTLPPDDARRSDLRERLVELHMPLVEYLARRFSGRNEPMADLVQVGAIGLIKAIDRFDPGRGLEFSTYATPTILGEIKRHFRDAAWLIHVPRRAQELQATLATARAELSQELQRAPTVAELAVRAGVAEEDVIEALDAGRAYSGVPLESVTSDESGDSNPLLSEIDARLDQVEYREVLRPAMEKLDPRERRILVLRFVDGKSQTEIAKIVGVSQMQVSRLVARSLARLREELAGGPADPDSVVPSRAG